MALEYRERKIRAGSYKLEVRGENGWTSIGEVYRMPYRNMSKSWRVIFGYPQSAHFDRPICGSKREAIETLKTVFEKGHL